jgi:hypothetical protein
MLSVPSMGIFRPPLGDDEIPINMNRWNISSQDHTFRIWVFITVVRIPGICPLGASGQSGLKWSPLTIHL